MIEVTNLTKKYGDHVAVDHLSFRVEKGHIYGFLGPNGAGKSTTMNIITGYLAATEGTVSINGKDVQKEPEEAKKCVGYLPEIPPLYVDMTVEEYLRFAAQLKKVPKEERIRQVDEVMAMTQITEKRSQLIKNLSKGYRQRVGLAQAILGYPEVIILDEPTVGLDPEQIAEFNSLIRKLGEDHAIILSSHILSEVSEVCDHIMIIAHGRMVASDTTEGLQKLQSDPAELELLIKDNVEGAVERLRQLPDVEQVEEKGQDKDGLTRLNVTSRSDVDVRVEVFYTMSAAQIPILGMRRYTKSLEDIFLELTGDAKPAEVEKRSFFAGRGKKNKESATEEEK